MWTLSGFSDEISADLETQCEVVSKLGLKYVEFRSAWDVNVLDLSNDQLATAKTILAAQGLGVSSIGSPIGKIPIGHDFAPHLRRMRRAAEVTRFLGAPYIRALSFFNALRRRP